MAEQFEQLDDKHIQFIENQHLFFVGTAGQEGAVNVSPKGMDSFRVIDGVHWQKNSLIMRACVNFLS